MTTVPNVYEETVTPQSSFADFYFQIITPFTEVKNSLDGSNASLNDEMGFQEASSSAVQLLKRFRNSAKTNSEPHFSMSPIKK